MDHFLLFLLHRLRLSYVLVRDFIWMMVILKIKDIVDPYFRKYRYLGEIFDGFLHQCLDSIGILIQNCFNYYYYHFRLMRFILIPLIISYLIINDNCYLNYSFWNDFRIILNQNYYLRYNDIYMEFNLFLMIENFVCFIII